MARKICIVTPSFTGGGAERVAVNLANFYAEEGHHVQIIAFNGHGPYRDQVAKAVEVVALGTSSRSAFFKLLRAMRRYRPEVVMSVMRGSNIQVGLCAFFFKSTFLFREASTMNAIDAMHGPKRTIVKAMMRLAYSRADVVVANSEGTKAGLLNCKIAKQEQLTVIGNPVLPADVAVKLNQKADHPWLEDPHLRVILSVGRLTGLKNHAMLLRSFAAVQGQRPELRLVFLGDGPEKDNLQQLAEELSIAGNIDFVAFQQNPFAYYAAADLFVLTSDFEGFGNVLVEAMAAGTPVISTDCPGGPADILLGGKLGALVPVNDHKALAHAIENTLDDEEFCAEPGLRRANDFTIGSIAKRYLKLVP
jgi:glycosyltransferase involved in cell wall biosynthesis